MSDQKNPDIPLIQTPYRIVKQGHIHIILLPFPTPPKICTGENLQPKIDKPNIHPSHPKKNSQQRTAAKPSNNKRTCDLTLLHIHNTHLDIKICNACTSDACRYKDHIKALIFEGTSASKYRKPEENEALIAK